MYHEPTKNMEATIMLPVHPEWRVVLERFPNFKGIIASVEGLKLMYTPAPHNIFRSFMRGPADIKVLIIGQDPYPSPGSATGLAFANPVRITKTHKYNDSLQEIMRVSGCSDPTLFSWLMQGVMLLNTVLTATESGVPLDPVHHFWRPLVDYVVEYLCRLHGNRLHLVMWGQKAQVYERIGGLYGVQTHSWAHPSPLATSSLLAKAPDRVFAKCPHFREITEIKWNTRQFEMSWPDILIFTDGACVGNGKPSAQASSAFVMLENVGTYAEPVYRKVIGRKFKLTADKERTNQRAELLAIWHALEEPEMPLKKSIIGVVTDSAYAINILNSVYKYSANTDIIDPLIKKSTAFNVQYMHINSHQHNDTTEILVPTAENYDQFMSCWNNIVDIMATSLVK